jgi:SulP family sulfate permease
MVITFLLTVLLDLTTAVEIGLGMAAVLFVKRMSDLLTVSKVLPDPASRNGKVSPRIVREDHDCPQISILTVDGALFFGAASLFEKRMTDTIRSRPKMMLLRMGHVPFMDTTGESNLAALVKAVRQHGGIVLVSGIREQPRDVMRRTGLVRLIGEEHFFERTGDAIRYALTRLDAQRCLGCQHFAFRECEELSRTDAWQGAQMQKTP